LHTGPTVILVGLATGLFVAALLLTWRLQAMTSPGRQGTFVFGKTENLETS
jgi:hypothetical protein